MYKDDKYPRDKYYERLDEESVKYSELAVYIVEDLITEYYDSLTHSVLNNKVHKKVRYMDIEELTYYLSSIGITELKLDEDLFSTIFYMVFFEVKDLLDKIGLPIK